MLLTFQCGKRLFSNIESKVTFNQSFCLKSVIIGIFSDNISMLPFRIGVDMCDTFALITENSVYLAKNSDRERDEPQLIEFHPAFDGALKQSATYLEITVPKHRFATWLSRPEWMWGAEMGCNEKGVAIGNQAVFTRLVSKKTEGLLGMDLLRLALEQSINADFALKVITRYLQKHGQGGAAGFANKNFFYDNSFLILDPDGGWQLETAGQYWIAKRISKHNPRVAISNDLSIDDDFEQSSDGLKQKLQQQGLWNGKAPFNFRKIMAKRFMS